MAQISTFGGGSSNTTRSEKGELLKYKFLSNSISRYRLPSPIDLLVKLGNL